MNNDYVCSDTIWFTRYITIVIGCVIISTTRTVGADALVKAQSFMSRCRKVISRDVATLEPAMAFKVSKTSLTRRKKHYFAKPMIDIQENILIKAYRKLLLARACSLDRQTHKQTTVYLTCACAPSTYCHLPMNGIHIPVEKYNMTENRMKSLPVLNHGRTVYVDLRRIIIIKQIRIQRTVTDRNLLWPVINWLW